MPRNTVTGIACRTEHGSQGGFDVLRLGSQAGLEASFAPQVGMTCCSLRHHGAELIGDRYGLAAYASCGITMCMSLMHPWADRLSSWTYTACGTTVRLPVSPLLHTDRWGMPVNGVQSCGQAWIVEDGGATAESAWLETTLPFDSDPRQLELFPYPHRLHLRAGVAGCALCIAIQVEATGGVPVPVCFGYRIYLRRVQPRDGTVVLPARRRLLTDDRLLPTGQSDALEMTASTLGIDDLHEVFVLGSDRYLSIASDTRRVTVEPLDGFPFAQVRAPASESCVMVEALTAAPNALNHDAFPVATSARPYRATLRLSADELSFHPPR
jgi:galactose mutarotase-like enzyme